MNEFDYEVQIICSRLYFGWVEKDEIPKLASEPALYRAVQDQLFKFGLELVDCKESKWYVVRLLKENDSFAEFHRYHENFQSRHLALLLILYSKLLLPRRAGQVEQNTELSVTFQELYQTYGYKFKPRRRKTTAEVTMKSLLTVLIRTGFIIKPYGKNLYLAGPAMYMLHDELLTDIAEASLQTLFGIDQLEDNEVE